MMASDQDQLCFRDMGAPHWGVAGAGKMIIQNYASETWGGGQCQRPGEALGGGG